MTKDSHMQMLLRLIRNLLVLFAVALPLEISGWFILLVVMPFIPNSQVKLPALFRWYDCADMYNGRDPSTYLSVCKEGWWARYLWLAWRNPCNYFGYFHLSFIFNKTGKYTVCDPSQFDVGNTTGARAGYRYIEYVQVGITSPSDTYYEYYWIMKWSAKKCLRIRFGWKIGDNKNPIGSYCQWVACFQPYIDYSGV